LSKRINKQIKSLHQKIKRYEEYIEKENPIMTKSIEAYRNELTNLKSKLRSLEDKEVNYGRISN